ncbi:YheC/YheD family protein [Cohnella cholangitidis]|uniref:YheC/YheD family protein n=1 Tax=Cohnella cholangitidis TaxID=2598458 RepID=A0A7G5BZ14_9BACL|nr:YheC/YheD family protein [Cohnella cholangitidis]QMV42198.1 YheC/YheD family protein [Cohnella cholangitidis]
MSIQRVRSKKAKTDALLADPDLRNDVPDTRIFERATVAQMLEQYGMIYVKPVNGTFGNGVIRVEKQTEAAQPFFFQSGETKHSFVSFDEMYNELQLAKKNKPYLAQQGIHLLKHSGRRFDLRIMVQKNPRLQWETTGMIGRVAHPRKIVTNYHAGGTPMPVDLLLKNYLSAEEWKRYETRLRKQGVNIARALEKRFPRLKEIGIDIAIDQDMKPWILEVNTLPDPYLFKKLPNRAVFRTIYSYAVAYGRFGVRKRKV